MATQVTFASGHLPVVSLVIEAGQVKQTVEEEDSHLVAQWVAEAVSLACGGFERDREVSGMSGLALDLRRRGKAENVGWLVFAAEGFVETTEG